MYDMYPWDSRADGSRPRPPASHDGHAPANDAPADPATQAVQVALDLRDNGGAAANAKAGPALAAAARQ